MIRAILFHGLLISLISADDDCVSKIRSKILGSYDPLKRPVEDPNRGVTVNMSGFSLHELDLDEHKNLFTVKGWFAMSWLDEHLKWSLDDCDVTSIVLHSNEFWHPDLQLFNDATPLEKTTFPASHGLVHNNGMILYVSGTELHSMCSVDLTHYPYDSQNCSVLIGSWTHEGPQLDIHITSDDPVDLSSYEEKHKAWGLVKTVITRNVKKYADSDSYFVDVKLSFTILRSSEFASVILYPAIVISMLCCLMFCLPVTSEGKLILGALDILLVFMYILYFQLTLPLSHSVPNIVKFFIHLLILISTSVAVSVFVIGLARNCRATECPTILKSLLSCRLAKLLLTGHWTPKAGDHFCPHRNCDSLELSTLRDSAEKDHYSYCMAYECILLATLIDRLALLTVLVAIIILWLSCVF